MPIFIKEEIVVRKTSKKILSLLLSVLIVIAVMPFSAVTANAAKQTKKLFHYSFDEDMANYDNKNAGGYYEISYDDVDSSFDYGIGIMQDWGAGWSYSRKQENDRYWFTDGWMRAKLNNNIRNTNYNRNWKISFEFEIDDKNNTNDNDPQKRFILGLANSAGNGDIFGLSNDGNLSFGEEKIADFGYEFTEDHRYNITYAYHDGIFNVYLTDIGNSGSEFKLLAFDAKDYKSTLESIYYITVGGCQENGTGMRCYDLAGYSYQDNSDSSTHLKAQYFTGSNLTKNNVGSANLTQVGSSVTWDSTNGAVFPESNINNKTDYFYTRTNSILSEADEITGFTFCFKGKGGTQQWLQRFFDYSDTTQIFSDGACNQIFLAPWWGSVRAEVKFKASGKKYTSVYEETDLYADQHDYAMVVVDGGYKVYVDGVCQITYANTDITAEWLSNFINNATIYLGASSYSDPGFAGAIKNFRVYDRALGDSEITSESSADITISTLAEGNTIFEKRIKEIADNGYSKMYTNISTAYECYKEAVANVNAGKTDDALLARYNAALNAMKSFEEYTGTNKPGGSNYAPEDMFYNNVIYSGGTGDNGEHAFSENASTVLYKSTGSYWKYGSYVYLYYPNTVLLYDGTNTPLVPVNIGFINKDHRYSINMLYVAEQEQDFDFSNNWWLGYDDSLNFKWPEENLTHNTIPTDVNNSSTNSGAQTIDPDTDNDTTTYRIHKNALRYSGTPTNAYTCYSSTDFIMRAHYSYAGVNQYIDGSLTNSDADIVIINYKKLTDALKSAANNATYKGWLSNLTSDYKDGGLEGIFNAFDSATTLDPNNASSYFEHTYDYAGTGINQGKDEPMDTAALLCAEDIDSSVNLLGNIKLTADKAAIKKLKEAIEKYEDEMSKMSSLHTNLEEAYNQYMIAVEYVDAYEYGDKDFSTSNPTPSDVLNDFTAAMAKMKEWSLPTGKTDIKYPGDTNNIDSKYYSNIIHWENAPGQYKFNGSVGSHYTYFDGSMGWPIFLNTSNEDDTRAAVTYPNTVLLYDGVESHRPKMPVFATTYRTEANARRLWYCYPTESNTSKTQHASFKLDENWRGSTRDESNWGGDVAIPISWNNAYSKTGRSNITNDSSSDNWVSTNLIEGYDGQNFLAFYSYSAIGASTMSYRGSGNTGNYYEKFNLPWVAFIGNDFKDSNTNDYAFDTNNTTSIYVINYAPLYEKIKPVVDNWPSDGIDVTKYCEGGLADWFKKIDILTSVNPSNYDYSTALDNSVKACAKAISNAVGDAGTVPSSEPTANQDTETKGDVKDENGKLNKISDDNGAYTNLKIAILEAESAPTAQGCIIGQYWNDYTTALTKAKTAMSTIASSSGYSDNDGTYSTTEINGFATALDSAITALSVDSNSAHPLSFSYQDNGEDGMYFQCHSNNSHIVENNSTVEYADGSVYNAMSMVYKTLDKTKYSNFDTIKSGKVKFDEVKTGIHTAGKDAQDIVNDGVAALITAINEANDTSKETHDDWVNYYNVTFDVYVIDSSGNIIGNTAKYTNTTKYQYGQIPTLSLTDIDVISALQGVDGLSDVTADTLNVQYWDINGHHINSKATSMTVNYQDTLTVEAYVRVPAQSIDLVIKDIAGGDFYTLDIDSETTIAIDGENLNTVTVGGDSKIVPNSLSYTISGWSVNHNGNYTSLNKTAGELAGSSNKIILSPVRASNRPKTDGNETVYEFSMDGKTVGSYAYDYGLRVNADESLCETYGGEVAGIAFFNSDNNIFVPVTYSDSYYFLVNRGMDFYTLMYISPEAAENSTLSSGYYMPALNVGTAEKPQPYKITDKETIFHLNYKMPMVYSYSEPTGANKGKIVIGEETIDGYRSDKWTTRSAFTADVGGSARYGDVTITECGTLRTLVDNQSSDDEFVIENVGAEGYSITKKVNSERHELSNQYSYSVKSSGDEQKTVYTRAYVKYSYLYDGTKIDAIAYGPVCASYYGAGVTE